MAFTHRRAAEQLDARPGQNGAPPFLEISDLSKHFHEGDRDRLVLSHAGFKLSAGEITAILGKSGSGKTTLLNLVSGIDQPELRRNLHQRFAPDGTV